MSRGQSLAQPTFKEIELPPPSSRSKDWSRNLALRKSAILPVRTGQSIAPVLRTMPTKPGWSSREVRAMRGMPGRSRPALTG
jgi:hypothetical protein